MMFVEFISGFPNGLSPTLGACGALIIATLDSAKKSIGFTLLQARKYVLNSSM